MTDQKTIRLREVLSDLVARLQYMRGRAWSTSAAAGLHEAVGIVTDAFADIDTTARVPLLKHEQEPEQPRFYQAESMPLKCTIGTDGYISVEPIPPPHPDLKEQCRGLGDATPKRRPFEPDAVMGVWAGSPDLAKANLEDADLNGANLKGADLKSTCMIEADLRDADLMDADLSGARLEGAVLPEGYERLSKQEQEIIKAHRNGEPLEIMCGPGWDGKEVKTMALSDQEIAMVHAHRDGTATEGQQAYSRDLVRAGLLDLAEGDPEVMGAVVTAGLLELVRTEQLTSELIPNGDFWELCADVGEAAQKDEDEDNDQ